MLGVPSRAHAEPHLSGSISGFDGNAAIRRTVIKTHQSQNFAHFCALLT